MISFFLNTTIVFDIHFYHFVSTFIYKKVREEERKYESRKRSYLQKEKRKRDVQIATNSIQQKFNMHWNEIKMKLIVVSKSQKQNDATKQKRN